MPRTERGGESPVPPRTLPAYQGLGLLGWRPSYMPGSRHGIGGVGFIFPPPKASSFLSSCSCLHRVPASSPLSLLPSLEFQNAHEVQEGGWGRAKPAPPLSTFTLGLGQPGTQAPSFELEDKENICSESQQTKEDGGVFTQDHCAWDAGWEQRAL